MELKRYCENSNMLIVDQPSITARLFAPSSLRRTQLELNDRVATLTLLKQHIKRIYSSILI